jgi:hypothetical protein
MGIGVLNRRDDVALACGLVLHRLERDQAVIVLVKRERRH